MSIVDVASNSALLAFNSKLDAQNLLLAQLIDKDSVSSITNWKTLQVLIRSGVASKLFSVGDQFSVAKLSSNTISSISNYTGSTGISAASIANSDELFNTLGAEEKIQVVYSSGVWKYDNKIINLSKCGLSITGTPKSGDCINISQTLTYILFDVIGINQATPVDSTKTNSITLGTHHVIDTNIVFNQVEGIYANTTGSAVSLTDGNIKFKIQTNSDYAADNGKTFYAQLLNESTPITSIPAGAILLRSGSSNLSWYNSYLELLDSTGINSDAHTLATARLRDYGSSDSVDLTQNLSDLTSPGTPATGANNHFLQSDYGKINCVQRCNSGNNNYNQSYIRQYINSKSPNTESWWKSTNPWNVSPSSIPSGWSYRLDPEFLEVIGNVRLTCAKNHVCDWVSESSGSMTYEITRDKFYLLSRTEIYGGDELSGSSENSAYSYYKDFSENSAPTGAADGNRIKYHLSGASRSYWLRSCIVSSAVNPRTIYASDGRVRYSNAAATLGVAPACTIL